MKTKKGEFPDSFKRAEERWKIAATVLVAAGGSDKVCEVVGKIIESAMDKGHKSDSIDLLRAQDEATRREVASTFSIMQQFSEQVMMVCTSVAIDEGDSYAVKTDDGLTGTLNLGDGDGKDFDPDMVHEGPSTKKIKEILGQNMPPEIAFLKDLLEKVTGHPVGVEAVEGESESFSRLQDDYEPASDPIGELARRLERMPGKKIRLPKKPLPEC